MVQTLDTITLQPFVRLTQFNFWVAALDVHYLVMATTRPSSPSSGPMLLLPANIDNTVQVLSSPFNPGDGALGSKQYSICRNFSTILHLPLMLMRMEDAEAEGRSGKISHQI